MNRLMCLLCLLLSGCAGYIPSALNPPAPRCMKPALALSKLKAGDNLIQAHADLRRNYAVIASRLACTQRYIKTVTK